MKKSPKDTGLEQNSQVVKASSTTAWHDLEALPETARLYKVKKNKLPVGKWKDVLRHDGLPEHISGGGLVGFVPASIGLVVVDVDVKDGTTADQGRTTVMDSIGAPLTETRTPSGGLHMYYRGTGDERNSQWKYGDIRGAAGYAIVYDSEVLFDAYLKSSDCPAVDIKQLPPKPSAAVEIKKDEGVSCCKPVPLVKSDGRPIWEKDKFGLKHTQDYPWPTGTRNPSLTSAAGEMQRRGWTDDEIETAVLELGQGVDLPGREIEQIIQSTLAYEKGEPEQIRRPAELETDDLFRQVEDVTTRAGQDLENIAPEELDSIIHKAKKGYWNHSKAMLYYGWNLGRALRIRKSLTKYGEWYAYLESMKIDPKFANRCMNISRMDWNEAQKHSSINQVDMALKADNPPQLKNVNNREIQENMENVRLRQLVRELTDELEAVKNRKCIFCNQ